MPRLGININDETAEFFKAYAERRGVSVTETVRRAASVLQYFDDADGKGLEVQLFDPKRKEITKVHIL